MTQELFDKYFIEKNGLWQESLDEVKEEGFDDASSIARLIYSCEIGDGIDQHAAEDLKAVSAFMMTQAAELAAKDAELAALRQERDEATEELTRRREEFETMLQRLIATEAERDALRAVDGKK